jgi:hypothetical protein
MSGGIAAGTSTRKAIIAAAGTTAIARAADPGATIETPARKYPFAIVSRRLSVKLPVCWAAGYCFTQKIGIF